MQAKDLPLFELFTCLQEAGLSLGLNEYAIALKALQAGFGVYDQAALSRLCQALWVKNEEEAQIFNYHFAQIIGPTALSYDELAKANSQISSIHQESSLPHQDSKRQTRVPLNIFIVLTLFLVSLAGLKFMPIRQENKSFPSPSSGQQQTIPSDPATSTEEAIQREKRQTTSSDSVTSAEEMSKVSITLLSLSVGSMLLGTCVSWLIIRQLTLLQTTTPDDADADMVTQIDTFQTEVVAIDETEFHLAEVSRKSTPQGSRTPSVKNLRQDEYFPLTRRQMKQGWRYLRRSKRQGPKTEFDIEGTVNQIASQGLFLEALMRAPRSNCSDLVLLIDQNGSMTPFHSLSERFIATALRSGRLGNASVYYFHNCPKTYLYHDTQFQEPEYLAHLLTRRLSLKSFVVVISDAGAARGGFNTNRILKTKESLEQFRQRARFIVWLNPLPRRRWECTTASEIENFVPMFEINRTGFQSAIDTLRGQQRDYTKLF